MEKIRKNRLFYHVYKNKHLYLLGLIALLIVDYLDLYIPLFIGDITDSLTSHTIDSSGIDKSSFDDCLIYHYRCFSFLLALFFILEPVKR